MANTPLSSASVDIVVFCLSLMGTDLGAYLTEASRVLKEGSVLCEILHSLCNKVSNYIMY